MKLLAIVPAFLAAFAAADQVWPLEQYDDPLPTFTTKEDITLTWENGYFNPYTGHDYTPATFTVSLAAYNNTPTGYFTNWFGQTIPTYEVSTVVEIADMAPTDALRYSVKPKLINGWQGSGYWYWFSIDWVGTNGVAESFGTRNFYLTDE
ncbi:hypothetical protein GGR55DRAFT_459034 [Xylaria sp. FL0064]|nr:hypothetical protein GGR55DRAFT_459034 [Xylaria sp. FL0064]